MTALPAAAVTLVRKSAPPHEIAGLHAAQAVRDRTGVIPQLVAVSAQPVCDANRGDGGKTAPEMSAEG